MRKPIVLAVLLLLGSATTLTAQVSPVLVPSGPPAGRSLIYVLQPDGKLAQYDARQFHLWRVLILPADAGKHPEGLSIGRTGEVLFAYPPDGVTELRHLWQSNPVYGQLVGGAYEKRPAPGGGFLAISATPQVYLSDDSARLFWFENRVQRLVKNGDISREASFFAWTTDQSGENPRSVIEFRFAPCACATGACEETCPEASVWAPDAGVKDFFFVTRWVPGQIGSEFLATDLYKLARKVWTGHRLAHPIEHFLDAADHGETFVDAVADRGCCGWENESDDVTSVTRGGKSEVIFDERGRFHNDDYDVSFFTPTAKCSPDLTRVAYTIASTTPPGQPIRLSSSGKENPAELRRIEQAIVGLPRIELVALAAPNTVQLAVANAELIGWLDDQRLLVLQRGRLIVVDASTGAQTDTGIKSNLGASFVFIR